MQQHREPLSVRDNLVTTGSSYETQSSKYTTHLGKSPVKVRPIRDMENSDIKCTGNATAKWVPAWNDTCDEKIRPKVNKAFNASGTVGLLFSFTEVCIA